MYLPGVAILDNTESLRLSRQMAPARFEKVVKRGGKCVRYYSDHRCELTSEYIVDSLSLAGKWIYMQKIAANNYYVLYVENRIVQKHFVGVIADIVIQYAYYSAISDRILFCGDDAHFTELATGWIESSSLVIEKRVIPISLGNLGKNYELKDKVLLKKNFTVAGTCIALFIVATVFFLPIYQKKNELPPPQISSLSEWLATVRLPASTVFSQATNLLSRFAFLPEGWKLGTLELQDNKVISSIVPVKIGLERKASLNAFLAANTDLHNILSGLSIELPIRTAENHFYYADGLSEFINDALILLGANSVSISKNEDENFNISNIYATFSAVEYSILLELYKLFRQKPIYLKMLTIELSPQNVSVIQSLNFNILIEEKRP